MSVLALQATEIPSGTKLYFNASNWTSYSYFSAYFLSNGNDGYFVRMDPVADENDIWEVTAPGTNQLWANVIFGGHMSQPDASGAGWSDADIQTDNLIWSGTGVLYSAGKWVSFFTKPNVDPLSLGVAASEQTLCDTRAGTNETLETGSSDKFLDFQWFKYNTATSSWERVSNTDVTPTITLPDNATEDVYYYFVGQRLFDSRLTNGDFEAGNTGFTSEYNYVVSTSYNALYPEGNYTICSNVKDVHTYAPDCYDHTFGDATGHMFAANGDATIGKTIWEQRISGILPNTNYAFSAWLTNWDRADENLAVLEFSINGMLQGGQFIPTSGHGNWTQLYTIWNSGDATSATIKLINQQGAANGNDFAVDDIEFARIEDYQHLVHYAFYDCSCPEPTTLTEETSVCTGDLPYKWHGITFDAAGTKTGTIKTIDGKCDSINYTLTLDTRDCTVPCPTVIEQKLDTTVCDTLLPYTWRGHMFDSEGVYEQMEKSPRGCDSINHVYELKTIHCEKEPEPEPEPEICLGGMVYAKWTNFLFCDNGQDQFTAFQWYQDDQLLPGETKQYLYRESGLGESKYVVEVTRTDGKHEKTCPVSFSEAPKSVDTYGNNALMPVRRISVPIGTIILHVDFDEEGNTYKSLQRR